MYTAGVYHPSAVRRVKISELSDTVAVRERMERGEYARAMLPEPVDGISPLVVADKAFARKLDIIKNDMLRSRGHYSDEWIDIDENPQPAIPSREERLATRISFSEHRSLPRSHSALRVIEKQTETVIGKRKPRKKAKQLKVGDTITQATPFELASGAWVEADATELRNWKEKGAVEFNETKADLVKSGKIKPISLRWIRTRKLKNGEWIHKSRIVAQGFKDQRNISRSQNFIGLPSASARRMVHVAGMSRNWKFRTADITTAYLQAAVQSEQDVYVKFPDDKYHRLLKTMSKEQALIYRPGSVHKVIKAVYGLSDSAKTFILHLQR